MHCDSTYTALGEYNQMMHSNGSSTDAFRDAQAPISAKDFDELDASVTDAEEDTAPGPARHRGPTSRFSHSAILGGFGVGSGAFDGELYACYC